MTRALTYVEIDIPAFTQTSPDSPETELTLRFAIDTEYLPNSIPAIASITDVQIQSATISLGEDLGQRGSVTVTFRDHRHIWAGEDFDSGTFWGKFRARYGLTLQGNPLRLIRGTLGQELEDMEIRHFLIDSTDGPDIYGVYKIIAKDVLALANGSRAIAPLLSNGFLVGNITNVAATLTLSPSGIGAEYPASGYVAIGGKEIVSFTRAADILTITRAQFNTVAQAHNAQDRVQLCLEYNADSPADIIYDLLTTYAGIDPDFISLSTWNAEVSAYLNTVYSALIPDPRPVDQLISELIEQAALALWWDNIGQTIRLQVLRNVSTNAAVYDEDNTLERTLQITEQPERRLSEMQVYFAKINPLIQDDEDDNYRSSAKVEDDTAVTEYGNAAIKKIRSRWIPSGGRAVAETVANKQLGRFRDPPRLMKFDLPRDQPNDPELGGGYQLGGTPFQSMTGVAELVPIQITRLNPRADRFMVEAEEMLWTPFGGDINPNTRTVIFDVNSMNQNLRTVHDTLYAAPVAGNIINAFVYEGVTVGSTNAAVPALDIGTWPGGVTVTLTVLGRIQGMGGTGGAGGSAGGGTANAGAPGGTGGIALYTRQAITLTSTNGEIWGGGGGGGGGGGTYRGGDTYTGGAGGGGGAGTNGGPGGSGGTVPDAGGPSGSLNGNTGANGTSEAGGTGVAFSSDGGGPGLNGTAGITGSDPMGTTAGGAAGSAGAGIDGDSFVTDSGAPGDIRGPQIN
jgi:hypothetical protein